MQTPPRLFDRRRIAHLRRRAAGQDGDARFLLDHAVRDIADRLAFVSRRFPHALDLGAQDDAMGEAAPRDRAGEAGDAARAWARPGWVSGDEEALPFAPASFDLVVSALALHLVNDLPGTLVQARRALKPDGLFLALLPGAGTLQELRDALAGGEAERRGGAAVRVAPFVEVRDAGALLQRAGFALPVAIRMRCGFATRRPSRSSATSRRWVPPIPWPSASRCAAPCLPARRPLPGRSGRAGRRDV